MLLEDENFFIVALSRVHLYSVGANLVGVGRLLLIVAGLGAVSSFLEVVMCWR